MDIDSTDTPADRAPAWGPDLPAPDDERPRS